MVAVVSNRELFIAAGDKQRKKSTRLANALAVELLNYGIAPDQEIVERISHHKRKSAQAICNNILAMYTIGDLNPPLFSGWETRTEFTFEEFVVQICGYMLQLNGNDLEDPGFMASLKAKVDFKKLKRLKLADDENARCRFERLVSSNVALDKKSQTDLVKLSAHYYLSAPADIKSAEARIAVLIGMVDAGVPLANAMERLKCQPADVLRFAAAKFDFEGVKLPADVLYASVPWSQRVQLLTFLSNSSFEYLCEAMGNNRQAWIRFFKHTHLMTQADFRNRFTKVVAAAMVSVGSKQEAIPKRAVENFLRDHKKFYDVTESGNLAFRTFASRIQSSVENQDFEAFQKEIQTRPNFLFRNIGSLSNVCTKKTESDFVELVRGLIDHASASVLFSIIQIDVNADFRIIDSKGNTTVTDANYSPVIGEVQGLAEREIFRRYGFEGQVAVDEKLKNKIVPFLSTNADLDRGTKIKFEDSKYLYFVMHWVEQAGRRTDLDHSYVCLDKDWNAETIYFGNQANSFIAQSGDITSAPAPNGGTEYGRIDLKKIPSKVQYIVPIMNVYCGDVFSENEVAYAGFMFSNEGEFSLSRKHVRYDLSQPANSNIPFVMDVKAKEIIVVDFNNRHRNGLTAHSSIGEIKKVISALKSKKFMTIERFAKLLSGDDSRNSLTIKPKAKGKKQIEPADLQSLIK